MALPLTAVLYGHRTVAVQYRDFDLDFPAPVVNFTNGFAESVGILFDSVNIWVTDYIDGSLKSWIPTGV
jgi:hypothetical protein